MRVLCLVPYPTLGASNRLRVEQYAPLLRRNGIELTISPFLDDAAYRILYSRGRVTSKLLAVARGAARRVYDLARVSRFDVALIHRESAPFGPPVIERALHSLGIPYVFDFDDAIYIRATHPANRKWAALRRVDPPQTTRLARAVIVGNEYLAAWARRHNANVTVIPTPVDTDRHRPRSTERGSGPTLLGWVGSSTTAAYLREIDEPLRRLAARHRVQLRVVGGEHDHDAVQVIQIPFSLKTEPADVQAFDIGLLPEPDDDWTRGKGAFKALLYMAAALPVVASRVGINPEVVVHGETGYCVASVDEWVDALERLIVDPQLSARLGAAGRRRAVENYSLDVMAPRLATVLRSAART